MREDLNKLLCERERVGHSDRYGNYRRLKHFEDKSDIEDSDELFTGVGSSHRESMKIRYGYDTKSFNENLNPLRGFIRSSVGKKWNKVYSEICKVFDKRSVINQHILVHLFQYVETKDIVVGANGKLWYRPTEYVFSTEPHPLKESSVEYYVDPRDGILKYNDGHQTQRQAARQRAVERAKEKAAVLRVLNDQTELHNISGSWFEVKFEHVAGQTETEMVTDYYRKNWLRTRTVYPYRFDVLAKQTVAEKRVAVSKRQLSHKELRKYGLTN